MDLIKIKIMSIRELFWFIDLIFYLKKKQIIPWDINTHKLEIELTTRCSLACFNCDRSIRQAPSNEYISIKQITKLIDESIRLNWKWKHITILGGEPTLHPYFFEIIDIIKRYKDFNPHSKIILSTNGYGKKVNNVLSNIPDWIIVRNSRKISNSNKFNSYNIAPIDLSNLKNKGLFTGCWIMDICGLGFTRYGFYPCGPGASIDRVFGFDIGIKKLSSIEEYKLRKQLIILCRYCGHFKENFGKELISEEKMSNNWRNAYTKYKIEKPRLRLY